MKLLLDTHTLIWALEGSNRLPDSIKDLIMNPSNEIYVSVVSLWEISIKHKKMPCVMGHDANTIREYSQKAGYIFLSLNVDHISIYDKLDLSSHLDPFDQILVTQSHTNNMRLLTHDKALLKYNIGNIELF